LALLQRLDGPEAAVEGQVVHALEQASGHRRRPHNDALKSTPVSSGAQALAIVRATLVSPAARPSAATHASGRAPTLSPT
jgi:hypothetical protein